MKVLFIASWYPNSTNPLKGIFIKKHAAAIKKAGVDIEVLALTVSYSTRFYEKKISKTIDENGIVTHSIELNSRFYKLIHLDLWWQSEIIKKYFLKQVKPHFNPGVIHSSVLYPAAVLGDGIARLQKVPHVITEHWSGIDKFMKNSLYSGFGKKAYKRAKFITAVSSYLKKGLEKHITDPGKIKIVPNVIDTNVFIYKEKQTDPSLLKFSCVAHWTKPKRPDLIFAALNEVSGNSGRKIILNVVGDGPLLSDLKGQSWNFTINYLGNLEAQKLAELHHNSDYFLHASDTETFSIVIAEALATGTPVLASNVAAIPELINSENGMICGNTIESWVNGLRELTQMTFDNKQISVDSQRFGLDKIGKQFLELYNS